MAYSSLDSLRRGALARVTALVTAAFFTFVFYLSPTGSAVAQSTTPQDTRAAELEAIQESSPAKKLAHRLGKLKRKVTKELPASRAEREANAGFWDELLGTDDDPVTAEEVDELTQLRQAIDTAYQEAIAEMDALGSRLQQPDMPAQAQSRHQVARDQVTERYQAIMSQLDALLNAATEADQDAALEELDTALKDQRFTRPNAPFDPTQLPVSTPSPDVRAPSTDTSQLLSYLGIDPFEGALQLAATQLDPQLRDLAFTTPNGPTQDDLEPTVEAPLTDEIATLAAELNHNPVEIYTWVHNNIRFIPSYGSIQGGQMTLETRRGNAIDTASLLIGLLRASGIPARYAYGTIDVEADKVMNWVGGVDTYQAAGNLMGQGGIPRAIYHYQDAASVFRLEHTWVEAYVDFEPSRGMKNRYGDHWIAMDASYKQYDFSEGYDLQNEVPFDAQALIDDIEATATVNDTEGWVQNVPQSSVEAQLTAYQQQLEDYIANQNPDATVGEVLGLREIAVLPPQPLSAGLPYRQVTRSQAFSAVPDALKHKFEYTLSTENLGGEGARLITFSQPTAAIAGKGLAVSFSPASVEDEEIIASYIPEPNPETGEIDPSQLPDTLPGYLINLNAEFSIEGEAVSTANAGTMGEILYETLGVYSPAKGWHRSTNFSIAGEYRAIGVDLQGSSPEQAARMQARMEQTRAILESGDEVQLATLTKHQVVGDLLGGTIFSYFALNNIQDEIAAQSGGLVTHRAPSYGLFRTDLVPSYWFGLPRDVAFSGLVMDVDLVTHQTVDNGNDDARWIQFNQAIGARYSAMEHLVPEQMFSTEEAPAEGISAVKALAIAGAEGQKIYTIDSNNLNDALAAIQLDDSTEEEIYNAVLAGNIVTTHQYQINFNGWFGEGYIILDPNTASGAYKIGGGANGGFLSADNASILGFIGFSLGSLGVGFGAPLLVFISAVIAIVIAINYVLDYLAINHRCSVLGYLMGLSVLAVLAGIFSAGIGAVVIMYLGLLAGGAATAAASSAFCQS